MLLFLPLIFFVARLAVTLPANAADGDDPENPNAFNGVSTDGSCGAMVGYTCVGSDFGKCCSGYGFCGSDASHCSNPQCDWGSCDLADQTPPKPPVEVGTACLVQLKRPDFCAKLPDFSDKASCRSAQASCVEQANACAPAVIAAIEAEIEVDRGAFEMCDALTRTCASLGNVCDAYGDDGSSQAN